MLCEVDDDDVETPAAENGVIAEPKRNLMV